MDHIDLLREDYSQTLSFIDKSDEHMFKVKNWALVTSSAVVAFAISQDRELMVLGNVFVLIAFLYLELMYKSFQDSAIEHNADISNRIDRYIANENDEELLQGYTHSFGRKLKYPSVGRVFGVLKDSKRRHISNFYVLLVFFSLAAAGISFVL